MWNENWANEGACLSEAPEAMFVAGAAQHDAKRVCGGCPVRTECLAEALDNEVEWGVWGGMTERQRRAILKQRPNVSSWAAFFQRAREEHEAVTALAGRAA